jgi:hypothetical protein
VIGVESAQVPGLAVTVLPTAAVPLIVGTELFDGATAQPHQQRPHRQAPQRQLRMELLQAPSRPLPASAMNFAARVRVAGDLRVGIEFGVGRQIV